MVIAFGTDLKISLHNLSIDDLITGVTFCPEVFGDLQVPPFLFPLLLFLFSLLKPGHFPRFLCYTS
jgi:hypothetical protein